MKKITLLLILAALFGSANLLQAQSPGGVSTNLSLWLKADVGTTTVGADVNAWADQSGNGYTADQSGNTHRPTLVSNTLNFNPSVNYGAGANDIGFDLGSDFIYAPAANGGMHIFSVVHPPRTSWLLYCGGSSLCHQ